MRLILILKLNAVFEYLDTQNSYSYIDVMFFILQRKLASHESNELIS